VPDRFISHLPELVQRRVVCLDFIGSSHQSVMTTGGVIVNPRLSGRAGDEALRPVPPGEIHSIGSALPPTVITMFASGLQLPLSVAPWCVLANGADPRI